MLSATCTFERHIYIIKHEHERPSTVHFPLTKENGDARLRRQPPHNLQAKAARASHVSKAGVGGSRRDDGAGHTILERDATP